MKSKNLDSQADLADIRRRILLGLMGYSAQIYLFGSWATGKNWKTSDVDVAILSDQPIPPEVLSDIRADLEDSQILCHVDLIDLSQTERHFQKHVITNGILWNA
ncbi:type VII toxin-antitoxin system MntA family adenylyltransferase antitoxin [Nitrospira sp. M1]